MQHTLNENAAQQMAQELVSKTQEIKRLSSEIDLLKLEIFDTARGGIYCEGGRIVFVDSVASLQFDRARLKEQLITNLRLSGQQAEEFIEACKAEKSKSAYIAVYLD